VEPGSLRHLEHSLALVPPLIGQLWANPTLGGCVSGSLQSEEELIHFTYVENKLSTLWLSWFAMNAKFNTDFRHMVA
jgi:hypothetical protein